MEKALVINPTTKRFDIHSNPHGLSLIDFARLSIGCEELEVLETPGSITMYLDKNAYEKYTKGKTQPFKMGRIGTILGNAFIVKKIDGEVVHYNCMELKKIMRRVIRWR